MVRSSYLPPVWTGTNARTFKHSNTQLVCMDHCRANPKGPCCAHWRKIYAHTEGPRRGSGDLACLNPLISFPPTDDSLHVRVLLWKLSIQISQQLGYLQPREGKTEKEHMCFLTGWGETECQLDVNLSDKTSAHFLFHKECRWSAFPSFALLSTQLDGLSAQLSVEPLSKDS